eukprot:722838-Pyramimonas_sp.AAC.1
MWLSPYRHAHSCQTLAAASRMEGGGQDVVLAFALRTSVKFAAASQMTCASFSKWGSRPSVSSISPGCNEVLA